MSTTSATPRWEPDSIKIQSPTLLRTENYALWRLEAQIHLNNAGVWSVVNGCDTKPTVEDPLEIMNLLRMLGIFSLDHKNVTSTIHHVSSVFNFKKDPSATWNKCVAQFESLYTTVTFKLFTITTSDKEWQQGLKQSFSD
ncbi:hypothetical protein BGX38DRAFT_1266881 [Terfezia claveryi]|nr:hypothetical protein BGX38DRAFT_1266881 [Terfezia claveryi]